ncbi:MAG: ArsR family transcriptional regulator [Candidatus Bathyarchaeota archaeon]|nr:ArsR family transcriptional regulator [Candidatus Bathyarchaeota archaeon]
MLICPFGLTSRRQSLREEAEHAVQSPAHVAKKAFFCIDNFRSQKTLNLMTNKASPMSSDLSNLYKILKDPNRQTIIGILQAKGAVSYTELLEASESGSTGLLNYHLKVLGDLVEKNGDGQYRLSEKGKVASSVLHSFPPQAELARKRRAQKIYWSLLAVGQIVLLASFVVVYFLGLIDVFRLVQACIACAVFLPMSYFGYKSMVNPPPFGSDRMKRRMRIVYPFGGAILAFTLAFLGVGLVLGTFARPLLRYFWTTEYWVFMVVVAPALGAALGYWVGKRNGFNKPKWAVWIDEKTGFS